MDNGQQKEKRYNVPSGFRQLLEALAREVLRNQPSDIYEYSAVFFDELLKHRAECNGNPISDSATYERFRGALKQKALDRNLIAEEPGLQPVSDEKRIAENSEKSPETEETTFSSIQNAVSDFKDTAEEALNEKAAKIQAFFRGIHVRHELESEGKLVKKHKSNEHLQTEPTERRERAGSAHSHRHIEEPDEAAVVIQSEVRGFLQRKHFEQKKEELQKNATTIQAQVRGFLTRKHMDAQGLLRSPHTPPHSPDPDYATTTPKSPTSGPEDISAASEPLVAPSAAGELDAPTPNIVELIDDIEGEAAAKIQAGFKGFKVRQELKQENEAATKIQAVFKGHLARSHLPPSGRRSAEPPSPSYDENLMSD